MHLDTPAAASTQPIPKIAIPLLSLASFASSMTLRVTDPLLPHLSTEFAVSLGDASHVITFCSVAYGFSQLLFGPLGDRYGKYFVIACACMASAVAVSLSALAPDFALLLASRLLSGVATAAIIPLAMAWIGDVVPYQQRQPVLARFLTGQILGLSAGVLVGGLAVDYLNWRLPFFGIASIFLAISIVLFLLNRRLPAHARVLHRTEGSAIRSMINEFREVLARSWTRVVLLAVFLEGAFVFGAFAFIASHIHHVHGVSLTTAGAVVMLFGFGGMLFAAAAVGLVRRLGESGLALWGGILVSACFAAIALAPAWWWAIPASFVAGLGYYMLHNTLQINATQMAPERRGAAVSAFASCFFLGQSAGIFAAGLVVERVGTAPVIISGAIGVLAIALVFRRQLESRPHG
jgi:predicted MFS family arabinose efflux permease